MTINLLTTEEQIGKHRHTATKVNNIGMHRHHTDTNEEHIGMHRHNTHSPVTRGYEPATTLSYYLFTGYKR
jgi:hypothetical protein